ncbi:MAG: 16S rRNA (cytosine(1402)-N(4))-methyltransferase RsmH [Cyclobacteriaceae bacterium]|nr:16S rRNA (cytosine(1402)-N(4))-methyltransferase RsmH [Cyclobacteriaceae bacterium]
MTYHRPVLLQESIDALQVKPDGVYVDLTFGGGGHALSIVEKLNDGGLLVAFDQDSDAAINATRISSKSFRFVKSNFRHFDKFLKVEGVSKADGIFADLGVSSHQIDTADRGFSTRFDGPLDMRMDRSGVKTARQIINTYKEEDLHKIFGMYGEIRNARTLAAAIVEARNGKQIKTIEDLKAVFKKLAPKGKDFKYAAQVFQALRIEVNNELDALKEMLTRTVNVLKPGGRLVVISYHSLEDRLVKNFIGKGKFSGEVEKDVFGNQLKPYRSVTRKPILASENEISENNRARSARMRIAEKI